MTQTDDVDLSNTPAKTDFLKRAEFFVALLLSLLVFFLLVVRAQHAGALWRDECTSMRLAELTTVEPLRDRLPYTLLFPAIVRIHTALFGASDMSMRIFGAAVGVLFIGIAWINTRVMRTGPPLVLLALIGLNSTFLVWGTNVRGYGLGTVIVIFAAGLAASLLILRSTWKIAALLLAGLCAPHLLVHDAPLIAAIICATIIISLLRKDRQLAFILCAVVVVIVAACLPFFGASAYRDSHIILKFRTSFLGAWQSLKMAFGQPVRVTSTLWAGIFFAALIGAIWRLRETRSENSSTERDLFWFALLVSVATVIGFFVFLRLLDYWPHRWYYLPLLGAFAVAIDLIFDIASRLRPVRWARLVLISAVAPALAFFAWPALLERQTNIDLIATNLENTATADDLIVINPWDHGVSFNRYYHGAAPFVTVPMMDEHRIHRYDMVKAKMMSANALDDLLEKIAATLATGHRVWLVGGAQLLRPNEIPHLLPPAPQSEFGWSNDAYRNSWSQQLGAFFQAHAGHLDVTPAPGEYTNEVEKDDVWLFEGWRE